MRQERGVTLVEVLVAMVIIAFVGMACLQILQVNARASTGTLKRIQASQYLNQIHNHLRRSDIAKLEDHYQQFPQIIGDNTYTAEAEIQKPAQDGTRKATLIVRWTADQSPFSISDDVTLAPQ